MAEQWYGAAGQHTKWRPPEPRTRSCHSLHFQTNIYIIKLFRFNHVIIIIIIIIIIILVIVIIIIIIISFMQGIYTHLPETNYVPREYSVAAILSFLFMVLISLVSVLNLLYFYSSTFRSMCAVPNILLLLLLFHFFYIM